MDPDDERHLFDLILTPAIGGLAYMGSIAALAACGLSIATGAFFYIIPALFLVLILVLQTILCVVRLIVANVKTNYSHSLYRYGFYMDVVAIVIAIMVILPAWVRWVQAP